MRLKVLSQDEADALYGIPCFTQEERDEYFSLSAEEKAALEQTVKYPKYSTLKDGQIRESLELVDFGKLIR